MSRRRGRWAAAIAAAVIGVVLYARYVEPRRFEVTFLRVEGTPLAEALAGLRFVALADIHVDRFGAKERDVLRHVRDLAPDYLLWLGDSVQYYGPFDGALRMLAGARGRLGTYGVLGDADYSNSRGHCVLCHAPGRWTVRDDLPVRFLRDQTVVIENRGRKAALVGVDPVLFTDAPQFREAMAQARGLPTLALSHFPRGLDDISRYPVELVLAGDTHGGQVWAPWPLSLVVYHAGSRRFLKGWFQENGTRMYVSRGVGVSHLPVRLGARPEIVVIDFGKPGR
jgi:uncharacterized protein